MTTAIIVGFIILGLCIVGAAFILSGAITGSASALKEVQPQTLQQPTMRFLTEYDTADYLGVSLNELDYMRSEGLLDGTFLPITGLEKTGETEYCDFEDGHEVVKTRAVMSNVTRFLFNVELLDKKMLEVIADGETVNPHRKDGASKKSSNKKNSPVKSDSSYGLSKGDNAQDRKSNDTEVKSESHPEQNGSQKPQSKPQNQQRPQGQQKQQNGQNPQKNGGQQRPQGQQKPNRPQGQNTSGQNGQNGQQRPNVNRPNNNPAKQPERKTSSPIVSLLDDDDDNDMKIASPSAQHSHSTASPVYDPEENRSSDFPIVKSSVKSISKPRIAVVSGDEDDSE